MKIVIISGSHRKNSQSEKVSLFIIERFKKLFSQNIKTELINLSQNPIPLFDDDFFDQENEHWKSIWTPYLETLKSCDGVIVVSPEWSGMVPPGLKNFLLLASGAALAHKPGLIVTVSASINGAYPVNELRTSGYKNTHLCYIPEHVIVRHAEQVLNGETPSDTHDEELRSRLDYSIKVLAEYTKALALVRDSGVIDHKHFPWGL